MVSFGSMAKVEVIAVPDAGMFTASDFVGEIAPVDPSSLVIRSLWARAALCIRPNNPSDVAFCAFDPFEIAGRPVFEFATSGTKITTSNVQMTR